MQAKGVKVKGIRQKFDSNLFSGFSIATTDATAAQIAAVQGVVKVWPVSLYDLPEPARGGAFRGKNVTPANLKRSLVDIETRAAANAYYPDNFSEPPPFRISMRASNRLQPPKQARTR